nr:immunoglobulin heavy chain junction region [Macaca mulatta]
CARVSSGWSDRFDVW